jgi:hypothetical protein
MKLPEVLSASIRVGATQLAMMGDQSQSKREVGEQQEHGFSFQAAMAKAVRVSFFS